MIRLAFSLFAADRRGLSQPELLRGLARDRDFTEHLQQTSHHAWIADPQAPSIPPILWTRLFGDVSFFFRMRHGPWGDLLSIRHGEFAAAIRHLYLEDPLQTLHVYLLLAGLQLGAVSAAGGQPPPGEPATAPDRKGDTAGPGRTA